MPGAGLPLTPYDYGWPVEVKVEDFDNTEVTKHYAMGRMALEVAYVIPGDQRTVYMSDDGSGVMLAMFVADKPGDLSSGTLYGAEWMQQEGNEFYGGRASLKWHNLGYANSADIKKAIDAGIRFEDMFEEYATPEDPETDDGTCPEDYVSVNHGHDTGQPYPGHECLKLKSGKFEGVSIATLASRLETRRYAALQGATTEFRKMEGITLDQQRKTLYIAMSEVNKGMENFADKGEQTNKWDIGGPNHIQLPYNTCGVVYSLELMDGRSDSGGAAIGSDYVAQNMVGAVAGTMTPSWAENNLAQYPEFPRVSDYNPEGPLAVNKCDVNGLANPDNITYIEGYDTLIIGEDTYPGHQNDMIWAHSTQSKALTRIQTTPYGAETTSPYIYPNINGWAYLMSVVQHPYGESDGDQYNIGTLSDRAYNGYFVFPAVD